MRNKTISVSEENFESLKKVENASKLINELLNLHFNTKKIEELSPEEIDKRIAILKTKIEAEKKVQELENGK